MKHYLILCFQVRLVLSLLVWMLITGGVLAQPVGNTISYQGRLDISGMPANGMFNFQAAIFAVPNAGTPLEVLDEVENIEVTEGLVNLSLAFSEGIFDGEQRYLELRVRDSAGGGGLVILEPRQHIFAAPYAISAGKVDGEEFRRGTIGDCNVPLSIPASGSFTFPVPFTSPPLIFLTTNRSPIATGCLTAGLQGADEFGFSWIAFTDGGAGPCNCIHWLAIGN